MVGSDVEQREEREREREQHEFRQPGVAPPIDWPRRQHRSSHVNTIGNNTERAYEKLAPPPQFHRQSTKVVSVI